MMFMEWVQDSYRKELPGKRDPLVVFGSRHVFRGGSWRFYEKALRSAEREHDNSGWYGFVGFRLVRTL